MKVAEAHKSSTANNTIQAKYQPFFKKEGQGNFFSKSKEATNSFFNPTTIQPKLTIGQPNDKFEVEADAMADKVVQRLNDPSASAGYSRTNDVSVVQPKCATCEQEEKLQKKEEEEIPKNNLEIQRKPIFESNADQSDIDVQTKPLIPFIQTKCAACEQEEKIQKKEDISDQEEEIQTKSDTTEGSSGSDLQSRLNSSRGGGSQLPSGIQSSMGSAFGADFSSIRIHTGRESIQMNKDLGAQAFTYGSDIHFNEGKYNTNSSSGQHLLAHELTHTIQQGKVGPSPKLMNKVIQKKPIGEEVQDKLRGTNTTLTTEAPIPGAAPRGRLSPVAPIGFDVMGYADLFESNGNIPGIRGIPHNDVLTDEHAGKTKYIYNDIRSTDLDKAKGPKNPTPTLNGYARFAVDSQGNSTRIGGSGSISGNFSSPVRIGEIKGKDTLLDNPLMAPSQLNHYRKGLRRFSSSARRDFGNQIQTPSVTALTGLSIPEGLNYDEFNREYDKENAGFIKRGRKRVWLAEVGDSGVYLWARLPHPYRISPAVLTQERQAITQLREQVLESFNRIRQNRPNGNLNRKEEPGKKENHHTPQVNQQSKERTNESTISRHNPSNKVLQKNTDWPAKRRNFNRSLGNWKRTHGNVFLRNDEVEKYLEEKVEFDRKLNKREGATGRFNEATKDYKKIEFWAGPKGLIIGNLRILLGEKFDLLAEKIEGLKERTRNVKTKAKGLKSSGFSKGWMARIVKLLLKGFGVAFEQFLEYSFSVFAGCISAVIEKFEEEMRQQIVEGLVDEELEAKLNELKAELEELITSLEEKYEEQLQAYEQILEQMKDAAFYTSIIATAVNLIRVGVQVVSCFTPPALGCLWGLVANLGIEVALNLVVGTEWFEEEFMKPLVGDLMEDFMKDSLLEFLNGIFEMVGLEDYVEGVAACTPSEGGIHSSRLYNPGHGIIIPPDMYQARATAWEARNRSVLISEIVTASGGTASQEDIDRFIEHVQDQEMSSEDFARIVGESKTSEDSFDFGTITEQIPGLENSESGEGESVRVIDGETSPMTGGVGSGRAGTITVRSASLQHVKGSTAVLNLTCVSNDGENVIITNVRTKVLNRYYFDSNSGSRVSNRGAADHMQIIYQITKQSGYTVPFSDSTGVLPFEKNIRGYVEF
ncbi:eCIS core domain-containing protein [Aquimarina sediminis]|uniref:eCIS core domain-containing protein n=1 Tax=Aquimarina sediminis TaxID=2070536 RepID=UPI000CA01338|nr:DUF4157 domain-containing protein [Aquimarina sediminis]